MKDLFNKVIKKLAPITAAVFVVFAPNAKADETSISAKEKAHYEMVEKENTVFGKIKRFFLGDKKAEDAWKNDEKALKDFYEKHGMSKEEADKRLKEDKSFFKKTFRMGKKEYEKTITEKQEIEIDEYMEIGLAKGSSLFNDNKPLPKEKIKEMRKEIRENRQKLEKAKLNPAQESSSTQDKTSASIIAKATQQR